jgi:hypothetical protein
MLVWTDLLPEAHQGRAFNATPEAQHGLYTQDEEDRRQGRPRVAGGFGGTWNIRVDWRWCLAEIRSHNRRSHAAAARPYGLDLDLLSLAGSDPVSRSKQLKPVSNLASSIPSRTPGGELAALASDGLPLTFALYF